MKKNIYSFLMVLISCAVILIGGQEVSAAEVIDVTDANLKQALITASGKTGTDLEDTMCEALPTTLNLANKNITDLTGLAECVNKATTPVTEINLSSNAITDASELSSLTSVTTYDLSNTKITTLTVSANVKVLNLSDSTTLTSLNLANATALENLTVTKSLLTALDVTKATNLKTLDLSNNGLTGVNGGITGLGSLQKLVSLNLSSNNISGTFTIPAIATLKELNLDNNSGVLVKVNSASNLIKLYLSNTGLTSFNQIDGAENLTKLELLELNQNEITSFEGLNPEMGKDAEQDFVLNIKNSKLGADGTVDWESLQNSAVKSVDITGHQITWTDENLAAANAFSGTINGLNIPSTQEPEENLDGVGSDSLPQTPVKVQTQVRTIAYNYEPVEVSTSVTDEIEEVTDEKIELEKESKSKDKTEKEDDEEEDNEAVVTVLSVLGIIIAILIILLIVKKVQESRREIIVVKKIEPEEEKKKIKLGDKSKKDKKHKDEE